MRQSGVARAAALYRSTITSTGFVDDHANAAVLAYGFDASATCASAGRSRATSAARHPASASLRWSGGYADRGRHPVPPAERPHRPARDPPRVDRGDVEHAVAVARSTAALVDRRSSGRRSSVCVSELGSAWRCSCRHRRARVADVGARCRLPDRSAFRAGPRGAAPSTPDGRASPIGCRLRHDPATSPSLSRLISRRCGSCAITGRRDPLRQSAVSERLLDHVARPQPSSTRAARRTVRRLREPAPPLAAAACPSVPPRA